MNVVASPFYKDLLQFSLLSMFYVFLLVSAAVAALYFFYRSPLQDGISAGRRRSNKNAELVRVLLDLDQDSLAQLMDLYERQFGDGAARYAKQTYDKWKSGKVRPNKQTFRRFLINLPKVMSFDLKCEVLRKLRETYCARDQYKLTVHTDDWKEKLTPLVDSLMVKKRHTELPQELQGRLLWLAEDDVQVANTLLDSSQHQQSLDALTMLDRELHNIEGLLENANGRGKVTHTIKLPYGNIVLNVKRR
jgi:hypothetical protein